MKENGLCPYSVATTSSTIKSYPCKILFNGHRLRTLVLLHTSYLHFTTPHVQVSIPVETMHCPLTLLLHPHNSHMMYTEKQILQSNY